MSEGDGRDHTPQDDASLYATSERDGEGDFGDLLQELRVLLQGVQVLTGFLIVLPFSDGFVRVTGGERHLYLALFLCVITSLVLFTAPAAQHRLLSPLRDRVRFKRVATRMVVTGMVPFSVALVLATHLVIDEVAGRLAADIASGLAALLIAGLWWVTPLIGRRNSKV